MNLSPNNLQMRKWGTGTCSVNYFQGRWCTESIQHRGQDQLPIHAQKRSEFPRLRCADRQILERGTRVSDHPYHRRTQETLVSDICMVIQLTGLPHAHCGHCEGHPNTRVRAINPPASGLGPGNERAECIHLLGFEIWVGNLFSE